MVSKTRAILLIISIPASCGFQSIQSSVPTKRVRPTRWTLSSSHLYSSSSTKNDELSSPSQDNNKTTVASQAALIAGTTIGGGFLALPAATAPGGFIPSSIGLIAVWMYLLGCSLSFANAIFMAKDNIRKEDVQAYNNNANDEEISIFSLVRECFGNLAGGVTGLLFLLLMTATLVAQLSKVGVLLQSSALLPYMSRGTWTMLFSSIIVTICLVGKQRHIERINDVLTSTMLLSFATLIALAGGSGWTTDGLQRANYSSLIPSVASSSSWAVPIFIQLLIYNEVVPLVSARLGNEKKVRRAILFGSSIPLLMCLTWSCVALGIVPYEPTGGSGIYDPLSKLSQEVLSKGGSIGKVFLTSVNTMAASAICTTVFGSILATTQYLDDVFSGRKETVLARMAKYSLAIFPSAMIAALGSSELYYQATSFAGEYPCTLLFGLIPPLCNLRLRWKLRKQEGEMMIPSKDVFVQILLAMMSIAILVACRL